MVAPTGLCVAENLGFIDVFAPTSCGRGWRLATFAKQICSERSEQVDQPEKRWMTMFHMASYKPFWYKVFLGVLSFETGRRGRRPLPFQIKD